jgi:hypothetical protein
MAKARKPDTARKPPVPSDSHTDIEDWIRRVMPDLHPVVKRLDELICETIPGLQFAIKWKKAYYGLPEDPAGGPQTGDAQVDRASRAHDGLEMRVHEGARQPSR